jgi:hypothetical protein
MDPNGSSPTLTALRSTFIATPTTSRRSSTAAAHCSQPSPPLPTTPPVSLPVTILSTTSWRTAYPRIGQFATTASEEVVAAGPSGLFYFKRVRDHDATPWSESRPLPNTQAILNDSSVSGLAIHSNESRLDVYCVSGGVLYSFYRSGEPLSLFVVNSRPPLSIYRVSGTPAVVATVKDGHGYGTVQRWSLVVPCQSGGLLHTSTTGHPSPGTWFPTGREWDPVDHVATDLGVISAVSITATHTYGPKHTDIVVVCVASARLYTVEGGFAEEYGSFKWRAQTSTRVHHPGEVTGNPVLVTKTPSNQLDLLVPSAEGGVFHFVRTTSTPDEWHMIARIAFPPGLPAASCLACNITLEPLQQRRHFRAIVQSGGRLYQVGTYEGAHPWSGSYLQPIVAPGPFSD